MSIAGGIDGAIQGNPGILDTPGLALDAASSPDPATTSDVLTQAANAYGVGQAVAGSQAQDDPSTHDQTPSHAGGFFGFLSKAGHFVGHALEDIPGVKGIAHGVGVVSKYLSAPLREIQRDYRFIHTVYAKDGFVSGFLATLGVVGGAALTAPDPEVGGSIAAEIERGIAGSGALGQQLRQQADLAASNKQQISFGRDIAAGLSHVPGLGALRNTNTGIGKVISGTADAGADWFLDPAVVGAKLAVGAKTGELAQMAQRAHEIATDGTAGQKLGALMRGQLGVLSKFDNVNNFIQRTAPGIQLRSPEQLAALYGHGEEGSGFAGRTYRAALDHIVQINQNSPHPSADIAINYPELANLAGKSEFDDKGNVVTNLLASAQTRLQAHQVFMDTANRNDMLQRLFNGSTLPTRTLMRGATQHTAEWLRNLSPDTTRAEQPGLIAGTHTALGQVASAGKQLVTGNPGQALDQLKAAGGTVAAAAAGKVRTFTGLMPFAMNKQTAALSTSEIGWHDNYGLDPYGYKAAYNVFKFGLGETNARYYLDQLMNAPHISDARRIWIEANLENFKAMGIPEGDNLEALMKNLRLYGTDPHNPVVGGVGDKYGYGHTMGPDVDKQNHGDAAPASALWSDQASHALVVPNFKDALLAQRQNAGAMKANYGKFDDIAYSHYMGPVFKTAALLNTGFALRVALAEVIPQAMRVGAWQHVKDFAAAQAATKGYRMPEVEKEATAAAVAHALSEHPIRQAWKLLGLPLKATNKGFWRGLNAMVNEPEARDFATRLVVAHDGQLATGVASTHEAGGGKSYGEDPADKARIAAYTVKEFYRHDPRIGYKDDGSYSHFTPNQDQYDAAYHLELSKRAANTPARLIARDLGRDDNWQAAEDAETRRIEDTKRGIPLNVPLNVEPNATEAYQAERKLLTGYTNIDARNWTPREFAKRRVDAMRGLFYGKDGTYNADLAEQIARGEKPTLEQISNIEMDKRPPQVIGGTQIPYVGPNVAQRIAKYGYARIIDPIINHLSRDPMYFHSTYDEYKILKNFVDRGVLDDDTAFRLAQTRGAISMVNKIHNTALKSQFAILANNFMPFWFAQEQALKRAGRAVINHPNVLRQYQLLEHGLNNPGFIHTNAEGQKFFVFPGAGVLGGVATSLLQNSAMFGDQMVSGLPLNVTGNIASLNSVFPEANQPGVSPLVSVPLNKLAQLFPELQPEVKDIVGARGFNQPALSAFLPSPITRDAQGWLSPDETQSAFINSWLTAYAAAYNHGKVPDALATKSAERDEFIARLKNNTRSTFFLKMLLGFVSPLAPNVSWEDAGLRDDFLAMVKADNGNVAKAQQEFMAKHGSKSISYTVAHSESNVPDFHPPYTNEAMNWINTNQDLIHSQFGNGAAWLIPQNPNGKGDVQLIQSELLRQYLRTMDTPGEFAQQVAIAQGQAYISAAEKQYEDFKDANVNNQPALDAAAKTWSSYVKTASYNNPIWGEWWQSPSRTQDAVKAYEDLAVLFLYHGQTVPLNGVMTKIPELPAGPQTTAIGNLLVAFDQHRQALAQYPSNTVADSDGRKAEKARWQEYLKQQANNPILYPAVTGLFSRLDGGLGNSL